MHHRIAQLCLTLALVATLVSSLGCKPPPPTSPGAVAREPNELLWGDTHVRTGARSVDVDTVYRFARGLPVVHPSTRARVQLRRPLDFIAVTEPAEDLDEAGWARLVDAAERHNVPCAFTTFIGWEWSSEREGHSLNRVVLMNEGEVSREDLRRSLTDLAESITSRILTADTPSLAK